MNEQEMTEEEMNQASKNVVKKNQAVRDKIAAEKKVEAASQMSKAELFLRELRAEDEDDYKVLSDRIAALVEELGMEAAKLTLYEFYSMTNKIEGRKFQGFKILANKKIEPIDGPIFHERNAEEMHPNPPTFEIVPTEEEPRNHKLNS